MDIIELFNPRTSKELTDKDTVLLQSLSPEQVHALAVAYPNGPNGQTYLKLYDTRKKDNEQLFNLSTYQNLDALWNYGQNHFKIHSLVGSPTIQTGLIQNKPSTLAPVTNTEVVDLSELEAKQAEGLKKPVETTTEAAPETPEQIEADNKEIAGLTDLEAAEKDLAEALEKHRHPNMIKKLQGIVDSLKEKK